MTMPQIGNTGVNDEDEESARIWAAALSVREVSSVVSNWRAHGDSTRRVAVAQRYSDLTPLQAVSATGTCRLNENIGVPK